MCWNFGPHALRGESLNARCGPDVTCSRGPSIRSFLTIHWLAGPGPQCNIMWEERRPSVLLDFSIVPFSPLRPSARPTTSVCGGRGTPGYAEVTVMLSTLAHIEAHRALETSGQTNLVHKQMCCRRGIKILVFCTCFTNKAICFFAVLTPESLGTRHHA